MTTTILSPVAQDSIAPETNELGKQVIQYLDQVVDLINNIKLYDHLKTKVDLNNELKNAIAQPAFVDIKEVAKKLYGQEFAKESNDEKNRENFYGYVNNEHITLKMKLTRFIQQVPNKNKYEEQLAKELENLGNEIDPYQSLIHLKAKQIAAVAQVLDIVFTIFTPAFLAQIQPDEVRSIIENKLDEFRSLQTKLCAAMFAQLTLRYNAPESDKVHGDRTEVGKSFIQIPNEEKPKEDEEFSLLPKEQYDTDLIKNFTDRANAFLILMGSSQKLTGIDSAHIDRSITELPSQTPFTQFIENAAPTINYFEDYLEKYGLNEQKEWLAKRSSTSNLSKWVSRVLENTYNMLNNQTKLWGEYFQHLAQQNAIRKQSDIQKEIYEQNNTRDEIEKKHGIKNNKILSFSDKGEVEILENTQDKKDLTAIAIENNQNLTVKKADKRANKVTLLSEVMQLLFKNDILSIPTAIIYHIVNRQLWGEYFQHSAQQKAIRQQPRIQHEIFQQHNQRDEIEEKYGDNSRQTLIVLDNENVIPLRKASPKIDTEETVVPKQLQPPKTEEQRQEPAKNISLKQKKQSVLEEIEKKVENINSIAQLNQFMQLLLKEKNPVRLLLKEERIFSFFGKHGHTTSWCKAVKIIKAKAETLKEQTENPDNTFTKSYKSIMRVRDSRMHTDALMNLFYYSKP